MALSSEHVTLFRIIVLIICLQVQLSFSWALNGRNVKLTDVRFVKLFAELLAGTQYKGKVCQTGQTVARSFSFVLSSGKQLDKPLVSQLDSSSV